MVFIILKSVESDHFLSESKIAPSTYVNKTVNKFTIECVSQWFSTGETFRPRVTRTGVPQNLQYEKAKKFGNESVR